METLSLPRMGGGVAWNAPRSPRCVSVIPQLHPASYAFTCSHCSRYSVIRRP